MPHAAPTSFQRLHLTQRNVAAELAFGKSHKCGAPPVVNGEYAQPPPSTKVSTAASRHCPSNLTNSAYNAVHAPPVQVLIRQDGEWQLVLLLVALHRLQGVVTVACQQ